MLKKMNFLFNPAKSLFMKIIKLVTWCKRNIIFLQNSILNSLRIRSFYKREVVKLL